MIDPRTLRTLADGLRDEAADVHNNAETRAFIVAMADIADAAANAAERAELMEQAANWRPE